MKFPRLSAGLVAIALTVGACGDSTGANTLDLSEAEAEALFEALDAVLGGLGGVGFSMANPTAEGLRLSVAGVPINESESCPQGGTVGVNGDVDENGGSFDFSLNFNNCRSQGHTIGGSLDYNGTVNTNTFAFNFDINGTLNVTLPSGTAGACVFDVNANFSQSGGSISGSVCGQDISGSASF